MQDSETLLDDVCGNDPVRVTAALQAAHGRGEELISRIITRLESVLANPSSWIGKDAPNPGFLLYLAAEFRATGAHGPIARLFRMEDAIVYDLLADIITEDGAIILADTCPGDPAAIIGLVEDPKAGDFERGAGLQALAMLWKRGKLPREDLLALMTKLASNLDPENDDDAMVANQLVAVAVQIQAIEIRGTILGLYDRDLAEDNYIEPEYTERMLQPGAPPDREAERLDETIDDAWRRVKGWSYFNPEPRPRSRAPQAGPVLPQSLELSPPAETSDFTPAVPYRAPPKVGRNDPCPCGSGRKFKKCCGA